MGSKVWDRQALTSLMFLLLGTMRYSGGISMLLDNLILPTRLFQSSPCMNDKCALHERLQSDITYLYQRNQYSTPVHTDVCNVDLGCPLPSQSLIV